jgi:subtilisin family serine protease
MSRLPRAVLALALALLAVAGAGAVVEQRGRSNAAARAEALGGLGYIVVYADDATPSQVAQARASLRGDAAAGLTVAASLGVPAPGAEAAGAAEALSAAGARRALLRLDVVGAEGAAAAAGEGSAEEARVLARLRRLPGVAYAVRDGVATVQDAPDVPGPPPSNFRTEGNAPWCAPSCVRARLRAPALLLPVAHGVTTASSLPIAPIETHAHAHAHARRGLDRIDQRALPLDGNYTYPTPAGADATIYVIDTGVSIGHSEFGGRASHGWAAPALLRKEGADDENGHGTHCAGTAAGATVGVAKAAAVVAVKVLGRKGTGTWSAVLQGIDWAVANCTARGGAMCVLSLSLGGPINRAVDDAVARAVAAGVVTAVAAGNYNADACKMSPARVPAALTVGATTNNDYRALYSNFGPCVDIYAPGSNVRSAWSSALCPAASPSCYMTLSGTSMAAPHAAGIAATVWSQLGQNATAADVMAAMLAAATPGVVKGGKAGDKPLLAYNRV